MILYPYIMIDTHGILLCNSVQRLFKVELLVMFF